MDQVQKAQLSCPLCQGTEFQREDGGLDSAWGFTQHRVRIAICKRCNFVMLFSKGRSFFLNFD